MDIVTPDLPVPAGRLEELHRVVARRCGELGLACVLGTETPVEKGKPYNNSILGEFGRIDHA